MPVEPLRVTVELVNGFVSSDPWSPALEAILAFWALREQLGEEDFALGMTNGTRQVVPEHLPLGREDDEGAWWWQASAPCYREEGQYVRFSHRRFDLEPATRFVTPGKTGRVLVAAGPYKNYRNRITVRLVRSVAWHCLGDRREIARLLARCSWLGGQIGEGLGRVRTRWQDGRPRPAWQVAPGGAESERLARFHRPLPVAFAAEHGIEGPRRQWGILPPGRLPEHRMLCVMPAHREK